MKRLLKSAVDYFIRKLVYDLKLKHKLLVSFSVFILFPVLTLGISSYKMSYSFLEDSETKSLTQSMTLLNNTIDYFFESYLNASAILSSSYDLQKALQSKIENVDEAIAVRADVSKLTNQIKNSFSFPEIKDVYYAEGITNIVLYVKNWELAAYKGDILPYDEIKNEEWCRELYQAKVSFNWQSGVIKEGIPYIALNRRLTDFRTLEDIGVMRIYIPYSRIRSIILKNMESSNYKFIYMDKYLKDIVSIGIKREDKAILDVETRSKLKVIGENVSIRNSQYIIGAKTSKIFGGKLIFITPKDIIETKVRSISSITIVIIITTIILFTYISIVLASFITKRIALLVKKTNEVDKGKLMTGTIIGGRDEIGQLDRNFNRMLERINNLIGNEYKSKITINKVRLELLQEQINPHMLYNTLSMICMISRENGQDGILKVTNNLIGFYKGILNRGKIICCLREEINMVRMYIEIMRFVHKIEIEVILDIDECILDVYSVKLLLQPVVENAIIHGLRPNKGGSIFIVGRYMETGIELIVSDNGAGMTEELLNHLNTLLEKGDVEKSYGLSNIIRRINLFFGPNYYVVVESSPNLGTTVTIRIPKFTEKEIKEYLKDRYFF